MSAKAAETARREIRAAWAEAVKRLAPLLAVGLMVLVGSAALLYVLPVAAAVRWFEIGFITASYLAAGTWLVHLTSGVHSRHLGLIGETNTADVFESKWMRRRGWSAVHNLYFDGHGDVDHVLVGTGGVWVAESKWVSSECRVEGDRLVGYKGDWSPLDQVRTSNHKISLMLSLGRDRLTVTPRPMLILWGPGAPQLPGGMQMVGEVLVCEGRRSRKWRSQLVVDHLPLEVVAATEGLLVEYRARQVDQLRPAIRTSLSGRSSASSSGVPRPAI